jgi:hypothetical protein
VACGLFLVNAVFPAIGIATRNDSLQKIEVRSLSSWTLVTRRGLPWLQEHETPRHVDEFSLAVLGMADYRCGVVWEYCRLRLDARRVIFPNLKYAPDRVDVSGLGIEIANGRQYNAFLR